MAGRLLNSHKAAADKMLTLDALICKNPKYVTLPVSVSYSVTPALARIELDILAAPQRLAAVREQHCFPDWLAISRGWATMRAHGA